jgi:hypothetical protein
MGGYKIRAAWYEGESRRYCRIKKECTRAKGNRVIERNERRLRLKQKISQLHNRDNKKGCRKQCFPDGPFSFLSKDPETLALRYLICPYIGVAVAPDFETLDQGPGFSQVHRAHQEAVHRLAGGTRVLHVFRGYLGSSLRRADSTDATLW